MDFTAQFWLQIIVNVASLGVAAGYMKAKLTHIETDVKRIYTKVDAHNHFGERLTEQEARGKSNTHRLDRLEERIYE